MNLFQILALLVVGLLFILSVVVMLRSGATRREGLFWAVIWLAAGVAIIWPDVTRVVARILGIGRGADLLLYCAVVIMMIGFSMVYVRLRRLQRELTLVVRHLAIRDAVATSPRPHLDPSRPPSADQVAAISGSPHDNPSDE